ncbi:uncharacterized protein J4E84_009968 [Alternaria hordeiaustralica]|uniref:uncharacterized protein n=1 Tax=Alternaria hordeiaustralica TaxID=1187925 RepID=UPI0020C36309|nr:uncharacterized protein J4E84_009968 [Alternaria hordeiaustralica]KAI4675815.1 hypothetical protein J4E84_009968 [Alternaria hordeiaustralica]
MQCTFNENPLPRKRRAVAANEVSEPTETTRGQLPLANEYRSNTAQSTSPQDTTARIRQDPPIDDYANLHGPSLLKKTLGLQTSRHSRLVGSTSEYERLLLALEPVEPAGTAAALAGHPKLRKVDDAHATTFVSSPDAGTLNSAGDIPDLDAIEIAVAPHGAALIHLFFRIVHPSFPILHKKVFLEKYERTHREFSPPLLAAVYLLALNWWSYSSELALQSKPNVSHLESLTIRSFSNIVHRPKLSTIQAGLLLLQRPEGNSWSLTSQLVGLAQDMGLQLDCTTWHIPAWECGLRKRLAWAVFMQDKWGALVHGRPSHITPMDWDVQPLTVADFPESAADEDDEDGSTEVEKGRILFCYMVDLTQILAQILSTFYTLKAERDFASRAHEGVRPLLTAAKPLQLTLRQWYANMPAALKAQDIAARKLSSVGYLHLGYYAVEITLHRRIIRSLSPADDPEIHTICRQAAQIRLTSAMSFVQSLRPEHFQSFWYSSSTYNFTLIGSFISLLWVTSPGSEEASRYRAHLDQYRWIIRLSSKSADFLERALVSLDVSSSALMKAITDETNSPATAVGRQASMGSSHDNGALVSESNRPMSISSTPSATQHDGGIYHTSLEGTDLADHSWFDAIHESDFDSAYNGRDLLLPGQSDVS